MCLYTVCVCVFLLVRLENMIKDYKQALKVKETESATLREELQRYQHVS